MTGSIAALFQRLTQGVYVVGVAKDEARNAFTAAWVMQVSFDPLLLALSINPHHASYALLKESRAFSVNVLKKGQLDLAEHYGQPARADKLAGTEWTTWMDHLGLAELDFDGRISPRCPLSARRTIESPPECRSQCRGGLNLSIALIA